MNLLFEKECHYEVAEDISHLRTYIQTINKKHIQELAPNFYGKLHGDTFEFKPRLLWKPDFFGAPYNSHSLDGELTPEGKHTKVRILVKPSAGDLLLFYIFLIILITTLLKIDVPLKKEGIASISGTFIILVFMWLNIIIARRKLIKRFEKLIH